MTGVVMAWMHGFGNGLFLGVVLVWALSWPRAKQPADCVLACPESGKHCNVIAGECQTCGAVGVAPCDGGTQG